MSKNIALEAAIEATIEADISIPELMIFSRENNVAVSILCTKEIGTYRVIIMDLLSDKYTQTLTTFGMDFSNEYLYDFLKEGIDWMRQDIKEAVIVQ